MPHEQPTELAGTAAQVAHRIGDGAFPRGERAELRRFDAANSDAPAPLALYRLATELFPEDWDASSTQRRLWRTLTASIAILPQQGEHPLGEALAEADVSEARVERLLQAPERSELLCTLWLRLVRHLAAKGATFRWGDAAALLFSSGESVRRRIAQSYYDAQRAAEEKSQPPHAA